LKYSKEMKILKVFFAALGIFDFQVSKYADEKVFGVVHYSPYIVENFIWDVKRFPPLSVEAIRVLGILTENNFISIDMISASVQEIEILYLLKFPNARNKFSTLTVLSEISRFQVSRMSNGEEIDLFYIHQ